MTPTERDEIRRVANDLLADDEGCVIGDHPDGTPLAKLVLRYLDNEQTAALPSDYILAWHDANGNGHAIRCSEDAIRSAVEERDRLLKRVAELDPVAGLRFLGLNPGETPSVEITHASGNVTRVE